MRGKHLAPAANALDKQTMFLDLETHGAQHVPTALDESALRQIEAVFAAHPQDRAGQRLTNLADISSLLSPTGSIGLHAATHLGDAACPVRAILFDKSAATNWSLGWHQDRTIAVKQRINHPGFGPWTIKSGIQHVAPPQALLERMLTLRVHLDPVDDHNAPLLIAPGSHRKGRIAEADIATHVATCGIHACLAQRGDVWIYATLILHASEAVKVPRHRRVLQLDYSADTLPDGLEWLGV